MSKIVYAMLSFNHHLDQRSSYRTLPIGTCHVNLRNWYRNTFKMYRSRYQSISYHIEHIGGFWKFRSEKENQSIQKTMKRITHPSRCRWAPHRRHRQLAFFYFYFFLLFFVLSVIFLLCFFIYFFYHFALFCFMCIS